MCLYVFIFVKLDCIWRNIILRNVNGSYWNCMVNLVKE